MWLIITSWFVMEVFIRGETVFNNDWLSALLWIGVAVFVFELIFEGIRFYNWVDELGYWEWFHTVKLVGKIVCLIAGIVVGFFVMGNINALFAKNLILVAIATYVFIRQIISALLDAFIIYTEE